MDAILIILNQSNAINLIECRDDLTLVIYISNAMSTKCKVILQNKEERESFTFYQSPTDIMNDPANVLRDQKTLKIREQIAKMKHSMDIDKNVIEDAWERLEQNLEVELKVGSSMLYKFSIKYCY